MKVVLGLFVLMSSMSLTAAAQDIVPADAHEASQIRSAESFIIYEEARGLSRLVQETHKKLLQACPETETGLCQTACHHPIASGGIIESTIGLIGIGRGDAAADALVNLLGIRLDAGGSETLDCQIFINGRTHLDRLERLQAKSVVEHCQSTFQDLQKRGLASIRDIKVERICHTEAEVSKRRDEFIKAIRANAYSDWEECYHQVSGGVLSSPTQIDMVKEANEANQIRFVEQAIVSVMIRGLSRSVQETHKKLLQACPETETGLCQAVCSYPSHPIGSGSAIKFTIRLIGLARGDAATDVLVNLLGLRLDGTDSEELRCQALIRGRPLISRLERLQAKSVLKHCQSTFYDLQKRGLGSISDVKVEQICRTEAEIRGRRDEFLEAIKLGAECPLW